ncbi:hypothetical protein EDB19DRAFT_1721478 [Suillus lakei]|nr:hypothetical protein EDB19DRAFT_1721478 [Suillus lakei]
MPWSLQMVNGKGQFAGQCSLTNQQSSVEYWSEFGRVRTPDSRLQFVEMSSLYRSAISARIAKLPQLPPSDEDDDEQSEIADGIGELSTGMGPPPFMSTRKPKPPNPEFKPLSPASYFSQALQISLPTRALDVRVYYTPPKYNGGGVIVFHHGAGYAGTSFAWDNTTSSQSDEDLSINVLLVGHSMGGSVCVRACPILQQRKYNVAGVAVLDVVEGTAVEALPHMHAILNSRPDGFDSVEEAVEWHVNTGLIHNPCFCPTRANIGFKYKWRTPLRSTAPYWDSWFPSLSSLFLGLRSAAALSMQGKFWLEVMAGSGVGHLVHEDDPTKLAEILADFWKRNERIVVRGNIIKRVGEV